MEKNEIRKNMISIRNSISDDEVFEKSKKICERVIMLPEFDEADCVLMYADFKNEVMTRHIFEECIRKKKKVYFPKCAGDDMEFYQVVSVGELKTGAFGIKEPSNINLKYTYSEKINTLVVIPGVAYDVRGYRIGYGKGFYDRFLFDKLLINKVGICFSTQLLEYIPNDSHDIKMDKIVTEELVYSFMRI